MRTRQRIKSTLVVVMAVSMAAWVRAAEMPAEPRGGQPSKGSKPSVENFADQVTYQRAFGIGIIGIELFHFLIE